MFDSRAVESELARVKQECGLRCGQSDGRGIQAKLFNLQFGKYGYIVEADIKGFFDTIDHDWLIRMLQQRIDDAAFLNLIRKRPITA